MGNDGDGTKLLLDPLQCLMCCHAYDSILSLKQTFYDVTDKETGPETAKGACPKIAQVEQRGFQLL